jgi:SPP1 family phage portal protein
METTVQEILSKPFTEILAYATDVTQFVIPYETIANQYEISGHKVFNTTLRPKKDIIEDTGLLDTNGNKVERPAQVEVCRIGYPAQWLIVERAVGFLLGYPVKLKPVEYGEEKGKETRKSLFEEIQKIWRSQKLDYMNRSIARILFSEREIAEIWYFIKDAENKPKLKVKLAYNSNKDLLYPKFDEYGDLEMFSRKYSIERNNVTTEHFDIYTATRIQFWERTTGEWAKTEDVPNDFKKIPVIYYRQPKAEWELVQSAIERYEDSVSNHGDTNDYTGSPITVVSGEIRGWSKKGERGKVLELEDGASVSYLTANGAPESIKIERDHVKEIIFSGSQTPDISFGELKNLGGVVSGTALENMYLDARMKAKTKEEIFGEMFVRRCNVIKAGICNVLNVKLKSEENNLEVDVEFTPFVPKNLQEEVATISTAKTGGFLSQETAVRRLAMVEDIDEELKRLKEETVQDEPDEKKA